MTEADTFPLWPCLRPPFLFIPSYNKWRLWRGLFFTETDILTIWGTQGPACLPMDRPSGRNWDPFVPGLLLSAPTGKEQETLLTSLPFPLSFLSLTLPILPCFLVPWSWMQESGLRALSLS